VSEFSGKSADATSSGSVSGIGEFGLISALRKRFQESGPDSQLDDELVIVGVGDDAAVVRTPDGCVAVSTDVLVTGVHFRTDWSPPYEIGRRAAAASLADIAAMGGRATALVVALSMPADQAVSWCLRLADGLRDEATLVGARVVGGDIARSRELSICVTALGDLAGRAPVTRAGAREGDVVAVCGRLGFAEAGLAVLSRGFRSPRALVAAYQHPEPPYAAGIAAARAGATAMCDVSDGLLADVGHIARESKVGIALRGASFERPEPLQAVAAAYGLDPMLWILTGGHDHALVATFSAGADLPAGFELIGEVVARDESIGEDSPVTVDGQAVSGTAFGGAGFSHFNAP